jgi:hypothetical protein
MTPQSMEARQLANKLHSMIGQAGHSLAVGLDLAHAVRARQQVLQLSSATDRSNLSPRLATAWNMTS